MTADSISRTPHGDDYFYSGGKRVQLVREPRAYAVKYRAGARLSDGAMPQDVARMIDEDSELKDFVPTYGLKVYVASGAATPKFSTGDEADEQLARMNASPGIEYATPVYRQTPQSRIPMYLTNRLLVKFRPDVGEEQQSELHARLGGVVVEKLGYAENAFLVEVRGPDAGRVVAIANAYAESGLTEWAHPDFIRTMATKAVTETDFAEAEERTARGMAERGITEDWHIRLAKVDAAWSLTRGSRSVRIAVIDDGVDIGHPEFSGRVPVQYDFFRFTADGTPKGTSDNHGTCCASVATSAGVRAMGVAPECSLMAIRMGRFASSDEANMFQWVADQGADVISCSWGPTDNDGPFPLPDATRAAIDYCVDHGRGGKGIPVFFAAGNGNELISDDGYASYTDTSHSSGVMAVAASTSEDTRAPYSDFGPEVFIAAPSNGGSRAIFAADRRGSAGYNPAEGGPPDTDYFDRFGGTSSATPLVAGVAGLMISRNPDITEAQIRDILRSTADKIGGAGSYDSSGHSDQYGYGRVNALRAVQTVPTGVAAGGPSITAPASASRAGPAPSFQVSTGGRALFAVEVATEAHLFNTTASESQRNESNFFASWRTGLSSSSPFTLPADAWSRLSSANRLYYRAHVADDASWSNHAVTTADSAASSAPSIRITASGGSTGSGANPSAGPSISTDTTISRAGSAPTFQVSKGGRALYAVDIATRAELFDASGHAAERTDDNFFASWQTGLSSVTPYTMPADAWQRLKGAERIWYRLHVADDSSWSNYDVTTPDDAAASAPSAAIIGGASGPDGGGDTAPRELLYPSGARFPTVPEPTDGSFADPIGGGRVPLVEVRGKRSTRLASNFRVSEFLSGNPRYARISPDLVRGLQGMRRDLGRAIAIVEGYLPPEETGAGSQHVAGWAVRVQSRAADPLRLAELALEHFTGQVSLGLAADALEIDLRPDPAVWVEPGAALDEPAFQAFVAERGGVRMAVRDALPGMNVTGPDSLRSGEGPPEILVEAAGARFVAIELATDPALFFEPEKRTSTTFYGSWSTGLTQASRGRVVLSPSDHEWKALSEAPYVYYRAVGSDTDDRHWKNFRSSLTAANVEKAPRIKILGVARRTEIPLGVGFEPKSERRAADMRRWSSPTQ